jgi:hypothetical protein
MYCLLSSSAIAVAGPISAADRTTVGLSALIFPIVLETGVRDAPEQICERGEESRTIRLEMIQRFERVAERRKLLFFGGTNAQPGADRLQGHGSEPIAVESGDDGAGRLKPHRPAASCDGQFVSHTIAGGVDSSGVRTRNRWPSTVENAWRMSSRDGRSLNSGFGSAARNVGVPVTATAMIVPSSARHRGFGQTKVEQLGAALGQHHVGRLQVSMHDPRAMCLVERVGDLHRVLQRLVEGKGPAREASVERLALEVLHDEE